MYRLITFCLPNIILFENTKQLGLGLSIETYEAVCSRGHGTVGESGDNIALPSFPP
jgi:hypothetical protein